MSFNTKSLMYSLMVFFLLSLGALTCLGCMETSLFTPGGCKSNDDCDAGYECDTDKNQCVEIEGDGDLNSDGDEESDGDIEIDDDIDLEEWLEKCDDNPPQNQMFVPCKTQKCTRVNPPECWSCAWVPDEEQNGDDCITADDEQGECSDGVCSYTIDGDEIDGDQTDGDQIEATCKNFRGRCARPGRDCHDDEQEASDSYECEGLCCIPVENVDCINDFGGYCEPASGDSESEINCDEGYVAATEPEGCEAFDAWCCLQDNCVKEGESGNTLDSSNENNVCCNGLDQVSNAEPDDEDECVAVPDGSFYCVKCGNSACGPGENICRCEEDCEGILTCEDDEDCPSASCADLVGGTGCQQTTYNCNDGECIKTEENTENSACNEDSAQCEEVQTTECESNYGYCTDITQDCDAGYYVSQESLGCEGDSGTRCCLMGLGCYDDSDCADDWCWGFSGLPNCIQYTNFCNVLICEQTEQLMENYLCNEDTGKCVSMNDPVCVQNGGYCSNSSQGCSEGYYIADSTAGCTGPSARCCLPDDESDCDNDEDCGKTDCVNTPNGQCMEVTPVCSDGTCEESSLIYSNHICNVNSGLCEEDTSQTCAEINGECTLSFMGCGEDHHVDESASCEYAPLYVCCVKD